MSITGAWAYRASIIIDHTKVVEDITAAQVLLMTGNFPSGLFAYAKANGGDIRFTSDISGATELSFEIVRYETSPSNFIHLYVLIPNLSSVNDTTIYVWYGNPGASAYATTDTYGRNSVWADNFIHVHHFQEASGTLYNSQGNVTYDGTGTNITYRVPVFDGTYCIRFTSGSNSRVALGGNSLPTTSNRTIHGYIGMDTWGGGGYGRILSSEDSSYVGNHFRVTQSLSPYFETISTSAANAANYAVVTDVWQWVALTRTNAANSAHNFYVEGALSGTANQLQTVNSGGNVSFGMRGGGQTDRNFDGWMQSIKVSSVVRSAGYLQTVYNNEYDPSLFSSSGGWTYLHGDRVSGRGIMRGVGNGIM
jgi:hypothetical protein